jgi:Na+-transporting NADH:ubiquinone oxidoreductase subunit NqrD
MVNSWIDTGSCLATTAAMPSAFFLAIAAPLHVLVDDQFVQIIRKNLGQWVPVVADGLSQFHAVDVADAVTHAFVVAAIELVVALDN